MMRAVYSNINKVKYYEQSVQWLAKKGIRSAVHSVVWLLFEQNHTDSRLCESVGHWFNMPKLEVLTHRKSSISFVALSSSRNNHGKQSERSAPAHTIRIQTRVKPA